MSWSPSWQLGLCGAGRGADVCPRSPMGVRLVGGAASPARAGPHDAERVNDPADPAGHRRQCLHGAVSARLTTGSATPAGTPAAWVVAIDGRCPRAAKPITSGASPRGIRPGRRCGLGAADCMIAVVTELAVRPDPGWSRRPSSPGRLWGQQGHSLDPPVVLGHGAPHRLPPTRCGGCALLPLDCTNPPSWRRFRLFVARPLHIPGRCLVESQ
jgi:hypothetical protein